MSTERDSQSPDSERRDFERATVSITEPSAPPHEPTVLAPGVLVGGKYRVEGVLGEGGMGIVLAAHHVRLGRKVALKLLRSSAQADERALRLLREAQSTSRLESPYVAELIDVEELPDRTPYLVLERLEGETLAARLRREGRLPLVDAADILVQAALGLAAAHAAGIIHRDVKPSNLFLTAGEGSAARVKVLDFGIAKHVASGEATLTRDAAVLGSPAYMSPEQTRGAHDVDERADVWALGATLFEVLSGELPFGGGAAQAVAARVAADPPRSFATLCPDCPRPVRDLVKQCLEKDPARRCPSAIAFLRALAPFGGERSAALLQEARTLPVAVARRAPRLRIAGVATIAAIAIAVGGVSLARRSRGGAASSGESTHPSPQTPRAFALENLRRVTFEEGCEEFPWWTPDGKSIAFDAPSGKDTHVFLLDLATGQRHAITSGPGWQFAPSVAPKGDTFAYITMRKGENATYVANLDGSSPRRLSTTEVVRPSWSPDGAFLWLGGARGPDRVDPKTGDVNRHLVPPSGAKVLNVLELADGRVVARGMAHEGESGLVVYPAGKDQGEWLWRADVDSVLELAPDGVSVFAARVAENGAAELWRVPLDHSPPARVAGAGLLPTKGFHLSNDGRRAVWSTCRERHDLAKLVHGQAAASLVVAPHPRSNDWIDDAPSAVPGTSSLLILSSRTGRIMPCVIDTTERAPARCLDTAGLLADNPSPSADGRWYAFDVPAKGIFVAPLDGAGPPRKLVEPRQGARVEFPVFSPDGQKVYFTVIEDNAASHLEVVPFEGGTPRRFLVDGARKLTFSPRGDVGAFVLGTQTGKGTVQLYDVATGKHRPLAPEVGESGFSRVTFSASGARAAFARGANGILEVDVASGKVIGTFDGGNEQVSGSTYQGEELIVGRLLWNGNIWVADVAR